MESWGEEFVRKEALTSGAGTNLKLGGTGPKQTWGTDFFGRAYPLLAPKAQLVVLVNAFVMVSTVLSVPCLLFSYSRYPPCPAICKTGRGRSPVPHGVGATDLDIFYIFTASINGPYIQLNWTRVYHKRIMDSV